MLLLASASTSRQELLDLAGISYKVVGHTADEKSCDYGLSLDELVLAIAQLKMAHANLPQGAAEGDIIYVLSADTLATDNEGVIYGKPVDIPDAVEKIKKLRVGSAIHTAFCLNKLSRSNGAWVLERQLSRVVNSRCVFDVPDADIKEYLQVTPALKATGAIAIEGYGLQFLKSIHGSYTAIIGLPLYELRQALEELDFFS